MVTVTQQRDTLYTKVLPRPEITPQKFFVHVLNASNTEVEALPGNWIARVKCVGTVAEWVAVTFYDMDGEVVFTDLHIDEADEVLGPFSKVVYGSGAEQSSASTETIQAFVWERNNG